MGCGASSTAVPNYVDTSATTSNTLQNRRSSRRANPGRVDFDLPATDAVATTVTVDRSRNSPRTRRPRAPWPAGPLRLPNMSSMSALGSPINDQPEAAPAPTATARRSTVVSGRSLAFPSSVDLDSQVPPSDPVLPPLGSAYPLPHSSNSVSPARSFRASPVPPQQPAVRGQAHQPLRGDNAVMPSADGVSPSTSPRQVACSDSESVSLLGLRSLMIDEASNVDSNPPAPSFGVADRISAERWVAQAAPTTSDTDALRRSPASDAAASGIQLFNVGPAPARMEDEVDMSFASEAQTSRRPRRFTDTSLRLDVTM